MEKTEHINWHQTPGMDSKYLAEWDLPEKQEMAVKVESAGKEIITGQGGIQEEKLVMHFDGIDKGMILNKTNLKAISKALNSDYIDEWVGHYLQLYRDTISVSGKLVKCIRVRDFEPQVD